MTSGADQKQVVYVDRIEKLNRENLSFGVTWLGGGVWLSTWLFAIGEWAIGAGGLTLLFGGTGISLLGMTLYANARSDRLDRTRPAKREGRF